MNPFISNISKSISYKNILKDIKNKSNNLSIIGLTDSSKAHIISSLTCESNKSSLIVCSNSITANKIIQDLKFFTDIDVSYFPARKIEYYDIEAETKDFSNIRMEIIEKINSGNLNIIVTTIDALLVKMLPSTNYKGQDLTLKVGDSIDLSELVENLVKLGFERSETVEGKGQFAIRGGIIDLYNLNNEYPYRIELFGNEIDSIRTFDPFTQRSIDTVKEIHTSYVSDNLISSDKKNIIIDKLEKLLENKDISDELKNNISKDIEKIESGMLDSVLDKYFDLIVPYYETLLDYVKDYNIYIDEPLKNMEKARNICYENTETIKILGDREYIYTPYANKYITYEEVEKKIKDMTNIYMEKINTDKLIHSSRKSYYLNTREENYYKNSMEVLLSDINRSKDKIVILVFSTLARVDQIKGYLLSNKVDVVEVDNVLSKDRLDKGNVYITKGILSGGFSSEEFNLLIIAEPVSGVNTTKVKKLKKTSIGQSINTYADLEVGDYVVHENHGIGIYRGVETISVQETRKDYIKIEYSDKGMLYVPITQLDSVGKFVCDDDTLPKLNSLGTKEWQKTKSKVTKHVEEIAKELVLLYAKREKAVGFAFSPDTPWQAEFEESFKYELTKDQKTSLEEIKKDMEDEKPMDRLLCGDVGYGKTELALRAAFKAVMDGKQVAYLVPTTVLSLQQYRTFKSRMESFGIRVEMLSRFKSQKVQTQILKKLIDGQIDVIVGTHRLLSKDVFFKDLGLLIIDEEHRFGVKAKEAIKVLKETIDVLSMTATPIPRTLHMSMIGIRQMSTLTEPPMERLPVHTYVVEYDDNLIKDAIEKELLRDGQVIYLNNRVDAIDEVTERVRRLVPNARIGSAHGQMNPEQVENIMLKFIKHELDIIVCTTILESGIDIPNANTLVVENSDKLGLAQLYQIRGRVGRSNKLAYAYITYEKNKQLSEVSEKRLKAIRDFTEFGSGFKIALRDLEIRGAGNLLGREQHGHMAKVGYELYLTMLERAVAQEKQGKNISAIGDVQKEVKIDIDISAYISDMYIKDPIQKILMYQKISDIKCEEDSLEVIDELLDRYGDLPKETENLIKIVEIRNEARKLGITRIVANRDFIKFEPLSHVIRLTNITNNDILIRVQLEISKYKNLLEEKG